MPLCCLFERCDIVSYLRRVLKGVRHRVVPAPRPQGGATLCRTYAASSRGATLCRTYAASSRGATLCRTSPLLRGCDIVSYLAASQGVRHCVVPMLRSQGGATSCRTCAASSRGYDTMSYLRRVLKGVRHDVVLALVSNPKGIK